MLELTWKKKTSVVNLCGVACNFDHNEQFGILLTIQTMCDWFLDAGFYLQHSWKSWNFWNSVTPSWKTPNSSWTKNNFIKFRAIRNFVVILIWNVFHTDAQWVSWLITNCGICEFLLSQMSDNLRYPRKVLILSSLAFSVRDCYLIVF